jgi:hypothetical protein
MKVRGDVEVLNLGNGKVQFRVAGEGESRLYDVRTSFVQPPIPTDAFDWQACLDGAEDSIPFGTGSTEAKAIADLMEIIES